MIMIIGLTTCLTVNVLQMRTLSTHYFAANQFTVNKVSFYACPDAPHQVGPNFTTSEVIQGMETSVMRLDRTTNANDPKPYEFKVVDVGQKVWWKFRVKSLYMSYR